MDLHFEKLAKIIRDVRSWKDLGVSTSTLNRILREALFFVHDTRETTKFDRSRFWTDRAWDRYCATRRGVVFEHAYPRRLLIQELLALDTVTVDAVRGVLAKDGPIWIVSTEENDRLRQIGLASAMPKGYSRPGDPLFGDKLARYRVAFGTNLNDYARSR